MSLFQAFVSRWTASCEGAAVEPAVVAAPEPVEAAPEPEPEPEPMTVNVQTYATNKMFPNQNQGKFCYTQYLAFHRCVADNDDDTNAEACKSFFAQYRSACPDSWTTAWDEQREEGTFASPYRHKPAAH